LGRRSLRAGPLDVVIGGRRRDVHVERELALSVHCFGWQQPSNDSDLSVLVHFARPSACKCNQKMRFASVVLEADALGLVRGLIGRQMVAARRERTEPNATTPGDADVKRAFSMLLSPATQRLLFLETIKNVKTWPRVKAFFGSPPYSFLRQSDDHVLNASGIRRDRTHMAPQTSSISSSSEVGHGHYVDDASRFYKIVAVDGDGSEILPRRALKAGRVVVDVRVAAMKFSERVAIVKTRDSSKLRSLVFPKTGERLRLSAHPDLGIADVWDLTVRTVEARAGRGPTARLYCVK